jgi:hypothetical protein
MLKVPVATLQVGCVTAPNVGWAGVTGCGFTVTGDEAGEVQLPNVAVTVYVPAGAVMTAPLRLTPADGVIVYV